ncbi:MAG TPA: hypothetical protein VF120_14910 [Ktedonobacterales bacterium]
MLPGTIYNAHEFQLPGITGMCGPESLGHAESWAQQQWVSARAIFDRCRANGDCDAQGVSTISGLADTARKDGFTVDLWTSGSWRDFFQTHESQHAIVYLTHNGQALRDSVSGLGEDATNLHGHILMVAGYHAGGFAGILPSGQVINKVLGSGWWACDPDNWAVRHLSCPNTVLQFYPDEIVAASQPVAAMAVHPKVTFAPSNPGTPGGTSMPLPAGWKDEGGALSNPTNSNVVTLGFRSFILSSPYWESDDVPMENDTGVASVVFTRPEVGQGDRQTFARTRLGYTRTLGVFKVNAGQELLSREGQVADLQAQVAALTAQLATATGASALTADQKQAIMAAETAGQAIADALKKVFG